MDSQANRRPEFSERVLPDKERSLVVLAGIYMLLLAVLIMAMYFSNIPWSGKISLMAALYIAHYLAARFHLILYKVEWFFIAVSISIWGMYVYTYCMDRLYSQVKQA